MGGSAPFIIEGFTMHHLSNLILDGFTVCFFFVAAYVLYKRFIATAKFFLKLKDFFSIKSFNTNTVKSGATRSKNITSERIVANDSGVISPDTNVNTELSAELKDWTEFDTPTYVRKGIVLH